MIPIKDRLKDGDRDTAWPPAWPTPTPTPDAQRHGVAVVFDGDSITAGNTNAGGQVDQRGRSVPVRAMLASEGRWRYVANLGVPGSRIDQMISRFDTTVATHSPNIVVLVAGANDVSANVTVPQFKAYLGQYLSKVRAIGATLVIGTLPPREFSTQARNATQRYNHAIHEFAAENALDLIDYYSALVNPETGLFAAGLGNASDGTHPTSRGSIVMGEAAAAVLARRYPVIAKLPTDNIEAANYIANPLNFGTFAPGPPSWTTGTVQTGVTPSQVTESGTPGHWLRLAFTSAFTTTRQTVTAPIDSSRVIPGHVYSLRGRIRATGLRNADSGNGVSVNVVAIWNGNDTTPYRARALNGLDYDIANGFYEIRFVAPADATSMTVQFQVLSNGGALRSGNVDFAQTGLYDLTAIGGIV